MAYTQTQLDALRVAIATGSLRVEYQHGDVRHSKTYRSLDEMLKLAAHIEASLASTARKKFGVAGFSRGDN